MARAVVASYAPSVSPAYSEGTRKALSRPLYAERLKAVYDLIQKGELVTAEDFNKFKHIMNTEITE